MLTRLYSPARSEEGFTLIELLIVVIIIGILAAIALPIFLSQQKAAADASVQSDVRNTIENVQTFLVNKTGTAYTNTGAYTSAGGNAAITGNNTVGVNIAADGSYQVCGYGSSSANNQYQSATAAYLYDSTSGKFQTGTCVTGSDSGGSAASIKAANSTTTLDLTSLNGWSNTSGSYTLTQGTGSDGKPYIQSFVPSNSALAYNADNSRTPFAIGHKYTVTIKAANSSGGNMYLQAGGHNGTFFTSPTFTANAGSVTYTTSSVTFTNTNTNNEGIYLYAADGNVRIGSVTIQDVTP